MSRTKQPAIVNITEELRASTYLAQGRSNIRTQEQTDIVRLGNIANKTYTGENLATKFVQEIANFDNEWAWIKARITAGNFDGLNIGDYIQVTCTNNVTFNSRIAGINTYKGYGDTAVGNHIDFISASVWPTTFKMNLKNFNNGLDADHQYPWLSSNGYHFLNSLAGNVPNGTGNLPETEAVDYTAGGVYFFLPDALKNVIVEKRMYIPKRFSASGIQNEDNAGGWENIGKLWLPSEVEVTGAPIWGCNKYGTMGSVQYPLFAQNMNRNIGRNAWWTLSATSGGAVGFVIVNGHGNVNGSSASTDFRGPVCFRVA